MFNIALHWFIVAQIFGLLGLVVVFITFQTKNKVKLLILDALANLLMAVAYFAMSSHILAIVNLIACFRDIAFAWLNKHRTHGKVHPAISIGLLALFWIAFTVSILLTWQSWLDLLILGLVLLYVFTLWNKGTHLVRILCLLLSIVFVVINVSTFNIMGIVVESVYIISITVFYVRRSSKSHQ